MPAAATYRACFINFTTLNTYNSGISNYNPTVTLFGSSSKLVVVTRIQVCTTQSFKQSCEFGLSFLTSTYSGGTNAAIPIGLLVASSPSATATPLSWSAGPTSGGANIGALIEYVPMMSQNTGSPQDSSANSWYDSRYGKDGGQPIILNGANQGLNLFFAENVVTLAGFIEWTEE